MEDPEVYEIDAELMERIFELLGALDEIKETLPPHIVGLMEYFDDDKVMH